MTKRKAMILFAHPALHKSRIHSQLIPFVMKEENVTFRNLYEIYGDFVIDVPKEQELLMAHDLIIFQHPFYWYHAPSLLKEWCDLVLSYGFAYGPQGTKLHGKAVMHVLSTGGNKDAYTKEGHNRFTMPELMRPWEQTWYLCGMEYLRPMVIYDARKTVMDGLIPAWGKRYQSVLRHLLETTQSFEEFTVFESYEDFEKKYVLV